MELGNLMFNPNKNQQYECPIWLISFLATIENALYVKMWNETQEQYESPFRNTGNIFKNDTFEVAAYNWNDEISQEYNFKWKDIEISWYKYLGRDTTINKEVEPQEAIQMLEECMESLR